MKSTKPRNVLIDNVAISRRIAGEHAIYLTREERRRAIRRLHGRGLLDTEIALTLGMTKGAVFRARERMQLVANIETAQIKGDIL